MILESKLNSMEVDDPLSRELRFQEVIFNDFKLDDENPYVEDIRFLERLYSYYKEQKDKKVCKKLKQKIISVKKYKNAFTSFLN